jgi:hypothetical protein
MDFEETEARKDCAGEAQQQVDRPTGGQSGLAGGRHGLDVRWSPASKDRSRWATEAEDAVEDLYQAAQSEDMEKFLCAIV